MTGPNRSRKTQQSVHIGHVDLVRRRVGVTVRVGLKRTRIHDALVEHHTTVWCKVPLSTTWWPDRK